MGQELGNGMKRGSLFEFEERDCVDAINPDHYKQYAGFEVIEITEQLNFCRGNVVKYVLRAGHKDDALQDLRKAEWYIKREIERIENARSGIA